MNRYYLCRRIGSGIPGQNDGFRPEIRDWIRLTLGLRFKQQVFTRFCEWCLLKYDLTNDQHDQVMARYPQTFVIPQGALDRELSALTTDQHRSLRDQLTLMQFPVVWLTATHTVRDVLQFIAHSIQLAEWAQLRPGIDLDTQTKTVADVPEDRRPLIQQRLVYLGIDTSRMTLATPLWRIIRAIQRQSDEISPRLFGTARRGRLFYHDKEAD